MKIVIKSNFNDWAELHLDGKCAMFGHSISAHDVLETIAQNADFDFSYEVIEVSDDEFDC